MELTRADSLNASDQKGGDHHDNENCGQIDDAVNHAAIGQRRRLEGRERPLRRQIDAKVAQQRRHIAGPTDRHGARAHGIFEHQRPADDPADEFAERGVGVGVGAARDGDHARQLGVAHARKSAAERGDHEADHHSRTGVVGGGDARQREKAGPDDGADAERDQAQRAERPLQVNAVRLPSKLGDSLSREQRARSHNGMLARFRLGHGRLLLFK